MLRNRMTDRGAGALKFAALVLGVGSVMLGGCSNNKGDTAALRDENSSLREQLAQLENALDTCEERNAGLVTDRDAAVAEAERLRGTGASTGFDGISGVSVTQRDGEIVVDIAGDVLFDSGQVALKNSAKSTLDQVAQVLRSQYAGNQVRIAGHTDNDPIRKSQWKTNERLSAERALAVEEYLAGKGLDKDRMYVAGYGSSQPKGSKSSSRRVEIVVLATGS